MYLTEEEAKTKICHRSMAPVGTSTGVTYYPVSCIASECMAWRIFRAVEGQPFPLDNKGWCGLAGDPSR